MTGASLMSTNVLAADELVGEWKFEEGSGNTVSDTSGNGNTGTVHGATWTTGISGNGLTFDGIDDYVEIPHNPTLKNFNQLTLEAWVNINSVYILDEGENIIGTGDDLTHSKYNLHVYENPSTNMLKFNYKIGNDASSTLVYSSYEFSKNVDHHIVGTYDGSTISLYVDGNLIESKSTSITNIANNAKPVFIGKHTWGGSSSTRIDGIIDEVKIYNYGLTASQVDANYQSNSNIQNGFAADSYIYITSGSFSGLTYDSGSKSIEVEPYSIISGSVNISLDNTGPGSAVYAIGATSSWGSHSSSYWDEGTFGTGTGTTTVDIDVTAPSTEGTYYIIIAGGWEFNAGQVMSGTNWEVGELQWDDGNDVAGWGSTQINNARANGLAVGQVEKNSGLGNYYFPADALKIVVTSSEWYIQDFVDDINALNAAIQNLPNSAFKYPPEQRKNAFANKLDAIIELTNNGNYTEALDKLEDDIRSKMDGDPGHEDKSSGHGKKPEGHYAGNDWVIDDDAREQLNALIDDIENADYDGDGGVTPFIVDTKNRDNI